jgi:Fe-S-cluster containining protein
MTMELPRIKPRRENLPADANLCEFCTAKCCRYFALPLETPSAAADFDYLRWYLLHDRAAVFVDEGTWYLLVHTDCQHLQADHRCGIYDTRPQICRDYTTDKCEYEDDWTYDQYFELPEQVEEYKEAIEAGRNRQCHRSPKPPLLPILTSVGT